MSPIEIKRQKISYSLKMQQQESKTGRDKKCKKLKGNNAYINEYLTKRNSDLAHKARKYNKMGLITFTWTHNCAVMIKTKAATLDDCIYIYSATQNTNIFILSMKLIQKIFFYYSQ